MPHAYRVTRPAPAARAISDVLTSPQILAQVADTFVAARDYGAAEPGRYRTGGWPSPAEGGTLTAPYSAPSAGPAPWHLYRLTPHTAVGVASAEPHGATRWDFAR